MTIIKIREIANYINDYMNGKEQNNYKTFNFFAYSNLYKILSNLLNAYYDKPNNHIIINNYIITISINDEKYEILITENELLEPKGPI
jgi:hypothetical protein